MKPVEAAKHITSVFKDYTIGFLEDGLKIILKDKAGKSVKILWDAKTREIFIQ